MQSGATGRWVYYFTPVRAWLAARDWPRIMRWLSIITTVMIFIVHTLGVVVTTTGSAAGCDNTWPLCKGQFIPAQFTQQTVNEFQHRLGVPIVTVLIVALIVGIFALYRNRIEVWILGPVMFISLMGQAVLGALAVAYPTSAPILAFHFGVSSLCVASVAATAFFLYSFDGWDKLRDRAASVGFNALIWVTTVYTYIVIYLGAYVLHTHSSLACSAWPVCDWARAFPPMSVQPSVINMTHRIAAGLLVLLVVWLVVWAARMRIARVDQYWLSILALVFVLAQALVGAAVVFSLSSIWSEIFHSAFVALFFSVMVIMTMQTFKRPAAARNTPPSAKNLSRPAPRPSKNAIAATSGH